MKVIRFRNLAIVVALIGAVAASAVLVRYQRSLRRARPNIILVSIDTLSAKHLNTYGYDRHTAPFIESWAKENFVFENSYAASSYTAPSHMSIFTGLHVAKHKLTRYFEGDTEPLDRAIPTLAELLKSAGYDTAWFGQMDDDYLDLKRGFERGFDFFSHSFNNTTLTPERIEWLSQDSGKPKFAFVHSYIVHLPYLPAPDYLGSFEASNKYLPYVVPDKFDARMRELLDSGTFMGEEPIKTLFLSQFDLRSTVDRKRMQALYDEEILYMDEMFRGTIDDLKKAGLYDNTIVILTSDQGEAFWEHGYMDHSTLHREVLNVPLIIHVPGLPSGRSSVAVQGIDILPTLMEVAGQKAPPVDGKSFWPVLKSGSNEVLHDTIFAQIDMAGYYSIQDLEWKLIESEGGNFQLYNVVSDPFETKDEAEAQPAVVEKYKRKIQEIIYEAG